MKKIKNILLSIFAIVAVAVFTPNVNADGFETDFVDNIVVVKEEDNSKVAVKFTLKKGVALQDDKNSSIGVSLYYPIDSGENHIGNMGLKVIDGNAEFTTTEPENATQAYGQNLVVGATLASYYDFSNNAEVIEALNNGTLKMDISVNDENYNYEYINYDIKSNTILEVRKGHDYESELGDKLLPLYPNMMWGMGDGSIDESSTSANDFGFLLENKIDDKNYSYQKITIKNFKDKTFEQICAEIEEQLKTAEYNMSIYEEHTTIDSTVLENIKNSQKKTNITETIYDDTTGKATTLYTWTFDGSKITDTNLNLNLKINLGTSKSKETIDTLVPDKEKSMVIEFLHHGVLPTGTTVKVNVLGKYNNGDLVTLYYYNEETKTLEMVSKNLEVKDGFVELALEHCSEYVLAYQPELIVDNVAKEEEKSNNAQTSSMSVTKYASIGVISLIAGIYLVVSKKRTA